MKFFRRLFASRRIPPVSNEVSPRVAAIIGALQARSEPCVRLVSGGDGRSRLGGTPDMDVAWPRYEGRPLSFVAQLDLSEIRSAGGPEWLPADGRLLFFYELERGSWGSEAADLGSAVVIHQAGVLTAALEPDDLPDDATFPAYPVTSTQAVSTPTEERLGIDWRSLNPASARALEQALENLSPARPAHQIGGYPSPVQSDMMEVECQDIGKRLGQRGDVGDWRLLLQLDTDEDAGMMWCDMGTLYFWIRQQDARAGDFSRIWAILQSC